MLDPLPSLKAYPATTPLGPAPGTVSVTDVETELPLYVAVTVAVWLDVTALLFAVKFALGEPADTVTDPGTVKKLLLSESEAVAPPVGAAPESVTVQVAAEPETRLDGEH